MSEQLRTPSPLKSFQNNLQQRDWALIPLAAGKLKHRHFQIPPVLERDWKQPRIAGVFAGLAFSSPFNVQQGVTADPGCTSSSHLACKTNPRCSQPAPKEHLTEGWAATSLMPNCHHCQVEGVKTGVHLLLLGISSSPAALLFWLGRRTKTSQVSSSAPALSKAVMGQLCLRKPEAKLE